MKILLAVTAAGEAAMGLAVLAYPPMVIRLLFGAEITGVAILISRFTGIALIGLGVACWPNDSAHQPLHGMLIYGTLAALYLVFVGVRGEGTGALLWPAVAVHVILVICLVGSGFRERMSSIGGMRARNDRLSFLGGDRR